MTPPSELSATWSRITGALQTIMSPEVYGLWFPKFSLLEDSGKALTLVCDDPMAALWVENSYTPELKQAAMLALGTERHNLGSPFVRAEIQRFFVLRHGWTKPGEKGSQNQKKLFTLRPPR